MSSASLSPGVASPSRSPAFRFASSSVPGPIGTTPSVSIGSPSTASAASRRRPAQVERLERAIAAEHDAVRAACLAAERASLLARLGYQADAEEAVAELRRRHDANPHPLVTPSINLADALVVRSVDGCGAALVKLRRAHALAQAGRQRSLQARVAAWMAHALWNELDVEGAVRFAREAFEHAGKHDHAARARACLVVGEMLMLSGHATRGVRWFARARQHASTIGDDATKSALGYNLFTIQVLLLRDQVLGGREPASADEASRHDTMSANLDRALGVRGEGMTTSLRAMLLSLRGQADAALALLERLRGNDDPAQKLHAQDAVLLAHEAWCRARLGQGEAAVAAIEAALAPSAPKTQVDDRASVHAMAARVFALVGDAGRSAVEEEAARLAWAGYADFQERCAAFCAGFEEEADAVVV